MIYSVAFTIIIVLVLNNIDNPPRSLTYLINIIGGAILSEYFFRKYFPDENYESKNIWKALVISIAISIPLVLAMIYFPG